MQELITRLIDKAGISHAQANTAIHTIKEFIKEKFPMMAGAVDNFLPADMPADTMSTPGDPGATTASMGSAADSGNMMDKISDFIPGEMGEKIEQFAKDKLGGMFGENK